MSKSESLNVADKNTLKETNTKSPQIKYVCSVFLISSLCCLCVEVEEVKRRQHCLMFSSAGSQAQTYFVNFDTLADYQRWHRQASKVSQRRARLTICTLNIH